MRLIASLFLPRVLLPLLLFFFLLPISKAEANTDFFLHGDGPNNNPPTLFLDNASPTASTPKFKDSTSVNFNGGNHWKEVGTWDTDPLLTDGELTSLSDLYVWLGLKNSDDQGTRFDVLAEVQKNGTTVASGLTRCVTGLTRNQNLAQEVAVPFDAFTPVTFDGATDVLSLKVSTRIGTNPDDTKCGGHNNAVGLRLYFDAAARDSRFDADLVPPSTENIVYLSNPNNNTVSAFDATTHTVVATIPVGNQPIGLIFNDANDHVYVMNSRSPSISVIDPATNTVVATIPVTDVAFELTLSADGTRLYAGGLSAVTIVDTTTNSVLQTLSGFDVAREVYENADNTRLYVVNNKCCTGQPGYVSVHDVANSYSQLATIGVGMEPTDIRATPDGSKIYVANDGGEHINNPLSNTISVIDPVTNTVTSTIPVGVNPSGLSMNAAGTRLYVVNTHYWTNDPNGTVSVIDTSSDQVVHTVSVGYRPNYSALSSNNTRLFVPNSEDGTLSILDTAGAIVLTTVPLGFNANGVTVAY